MKKLFCWIAGRAWRTVERLVDWVDAQIMRLNVAAFLLFLVWIAVATYIFAVVVGCLYSFVFGALSFDASYVVVLWRAYFWWLPEIV